MRPEKARLHRRKHDCIRIVLIPSHGQNIIERDGTERPKSGTHASENITCYLEGQFTHFQQRRDVSAIEVLRCMPQATVSLAGKLMQWVIMPPEGYSIRITLTHRDIGGRGMWMDCLFDLGELLPSAESKYIQTV